MSINITQNDINLAADNYTTLYGNDVEITAPITLDVGDVFKIENSAAPFNHVGTYYRYSRDFVTQYEYFSYDASGMVGTFTVSSDLRNGTLVLDVDLISFNVTQSLLDQVSNNNLTMYHNSELIDSPTTVTAGVISFVVDAGYVFADVGNVVNLSDFQGSRPLDISSDNKTASTPLDHGFNSFGFNVLVDDSEFSIVGFNNIYLIDEDIYNSIQNDRFITSTYDGIEFDFGSYIVKAIQLPFTIDESFIGPEDFIRLATKQLETKAPTINNDEIIIDLGSIEVPEKFGDGRDYTNVSGILHLPYNSNISIDVQKFMGGTIYIKYLVNMYDGNAVAIIESSVTGDIIETNSFNIGYEIPINQVIDFRAIGTISPNRVNNEVARPFLEVTRNVPDDVNIYENLSFCYGAIELKQGFMIVDNINIVGDISNFEKQQLISILGQGVIINE